MLKLSIQLCKRNKCRFSDKSITTPPSSVLVVPSQHLAFHSIIKASRPLAYSLNSDGMPTYDHDPERPCFTHGLAIIIIAKLVLVLSSKTHAWRFGGAGEYVYKQQIIMGILLTINRYQPVIHYLSGNKMQSNYI